MTLEILKQVGQVAGIGGLALGVFLLLFREVIRKSIYPQLTRGSAYRLLRMILVLVWSIAILGVLIWAYVATRPDPKYLPGRLDVTDVSVDRYRPDTSAKSDPDVPGPTEVTDISVNDYNPDFNAVLDFRVANHGNRPLSINRIRFTVVRTESVPTLGYLDYSAKYHLDISDLRKVGDAKDVIVSQSLQPGEVDRFAVILTARHMAMGEFRLWELKPTLFTSEGNVTPSATIKLGLPWNIATSMTLPGTIVDRPELHYSCEPLGKLDIQNDEEIVFHSHVEENFEEANIHFMFKTGPDVRVNFLPSGSDYLTGFSSDVNKRALNIKDIRVTFRNHTASCELTN